MKCPKCGYFGSDYLDTCKKCGKDLLEEKAKLGLRSIKLRNPHPRPTPKKQPIPFILSPEELKSISPLQEKTAPLFTEPSPSLVVAPPSELKSKKQDFSTKPLDVKFDKQAKPFDEEFEQNFLLKTKQEAESPFAAPGEDTQDIAISQDALEDFEFPDELTQNPHPVKVPSKEEGIPFSDKEENEKEIGEVPSDRVQTEPLDNEEIAKLLEDINPEPSESDKATYE